MHKLHQEHHTKSSLSRRKTKLKSRRLLLLPFLFPSPVLSNTHPLSNIPLGNTSNGQLQSILEPFPNGICNFLPIILPSQPFCRKTLRDGTKLHIVNGVDEIEDVSEDGFGRGYGDRGYRSVCGRGRGCVRWRDIVYGWLD